MLRQNAAPITVAAILFIAALAITAWAGYALNEANTWVTHSYQVMAELDSLYDSVERAESDMRGYVLTGDPNLRAMLPTLKQRVNNKFAGLSQLLTDSPDQAALLRRLHSEAQETLNFAASVDNLYQRSPQAAGDLIRKTHGTSIMSAIGDTRARLLDIETRLLDERTRHLETMKFLAVPIACVLAASGLAMLLLTVSTTRLMLTNEALRGDELERVNEQLQESKRLFDSFMQYTPALAWVKNAEGLIIWANEHYYKTFQLRPDQVIGKRSSDVYPYLSQIAVEASDEHIIQGDLLVEHVVSIPLPTGERHFFVAKFPIEISHGKVVGGIAVDITEQYQAEEQIVELNRQLQKHVQQLETARDKALEVSALKSAFVANISHEIRTPLSGIIGMNELLLNTELNDDQRSLAQTVHESSMSLLTVLNDILDLSKIEAGKMRFQLAPFNLKWLMQDSIKLMSAAAGAKGLQLTLEYDDSIAKHLIGDAERIRQVLLNLIGNAVKFTQQGKIIVSARAVSRNEDEVVVTFSVCDTGIGISNEDRKYLFVPFAQVDNSNARRFGGTGLGLTICKKLVAGMGGDIDVRSEPGKGSTFYFNLPLKKHAADQATKPATKMPRQAEGMHKVVLVVEDNPVLQHLTVMQLTNLGVSTRVAATGLEALHSVEQMRYDLIFMDVHLPKMSGFEVTERIREMEKNIGIHTPIVAMTAGAMEGDKQRCLAAGMDDYLSKPVSMDSLRALLDKWFGPTGRESKTA
ncbi:MAG TPA: ATP-binding protein [Candidatus Obscuribacterales bacterium]